MSSQHHAHEPAITLDNRDPFIAACIIHKRQRDSIFFQTIRSFLNERKPGAWRYQIPIVAASLGELEQNLPQTIDPDFVAFPRRAPRKILAVQTAKRAVRKKNRPGSAGADSGGSPRVGPSGRFS